MYSPRFLHPSGVNPAGLFGRLEFYSSGIISLTNSGEFARLARSVVKMAKETTRKADTISNPEHTTPQSASSVPSGTSTRIVDVPVSTDHMATNEPNVDIERSSAFSCGILNPTPDLEDNLDIFDALANATSSTGQDPAWKNWNMSGMMPIMCDFPLSNGMDLNAIFAFGNRGGENWNLTDAVQASRADRAGTGT